MSVLWERAKAPHRHEFFCLDLSRHCWHSFGNDNDLYSKHCGHSRVVRWLPSYRHSTVTVSHWQFDIDCAMPLPWIPLE